MRWLVISGTDYVRRLESLRESLSNRGIEAYFTNDLLNLRYLTAFQGTAGGLLVTAGGDGDSLLVDGRYRNYSEQLPVSSVEVELVDDSRIKLLDELLGHKNISSVHFERENLTYDTFLDLRNLVTSPDKKSYGTDLVLEDRKSKTEDEVDSIREAIDQTLDVFELIDSWLEPGLSEKNLSRAIRGELENRSEGLAFDPLVLTGSNTANPHCPASGRRLEEDDWLLVDQGMKINGYCSDLTRMFFLERPDPKIRELYDLSKRSAARAYEAIEPGKSISSVVEEAHGLIVEEGHEENLRHGLGHGVGLNVHEPPSLSSKTDGAFEPGMVVTLEPGIYIDGFGGARIEHMVYVKESGPQLLDTPDEHLEEVL